MTLLESAIEYATEKHKAQTYDGESYNRHLNWVYSTAVKFGCVDEEILAACYLHDTVEDTDATLEELSAKFGARVSDMVYRVTDEPGKNRKERHANTYGKIKASPDATLVKLADRIANVSASILIKDKSTLLQMYKKEAKQFRELIHVPGVHEEMWAHLEELLKTK